MKIRIVFIVLLLTGFRFATAVYAQPASPADTLSLDEAVNQVIKANPTVLAAQQAVEEAEGRIGIARSGYLPTVDAEASYSRVGPVQQFDFPGVGTVKLFPENNYSASVNVRQLIYDFGRTSQSIRLAEATRDLSSESIKLVRQNLAMSVISTYYSILMVQEALQINNDELKRLNEHLDFIQRMKATGSATDYEILSTKVKISAIENKKTDLLASRESLSATMNALLGRPVDRIVYVKRDQGYRSETISTDSMLNMAMRNREELKLAGQKEDLAKIQYELSKSANNPTISAFASGGGKNGYIPNLNAFKANYAAGVSLNVPLFDGHREQSNIRIARAKMESTQYETEKEKRKVSIEVVKAKSDLKSSTQKITQVELQLEQARQAYQLAQTNFKAGTITNLDLLDAEISLAASKLMLVQAKVDYVLNLSRLKMALGEPLYREDPS